MKRAQKARWFLSGVLVAALAVHLISPAVAAMAGRTIEVFTGVNVYVNDQLVQPKDADGNPVEVFVYNGTTYLPIRAIGNALGMPVQWEGKTSSAYVGKHQGDKPAVWLKDLDYFTGSYWNTFSEKDNLGVEHKNAIGYSRDNTYLLNGQYSAISGTLFQQYEDRSDFRTSTLEIYGDGELLYSAEMKGGIKPLDFYVSLAGVLELRVCFTCNNALIADCGLWA